MTSGNNRWLDASSLVLSDYYLYGICSYDIASSWLQDGAFSFVLGDAGNCAPLNDLQTGILNSISSATIFNLPSLSLAHTRDDLKTKLFVRDKSANSEAKRKVLGTIYLLVVVLFDRPPPDGLPVVLGQPPPFP